MFSIKLQTKIVHLRASNTAIKSATIIDYVGNITVVGPEFGKLSCEVDSVYSNTDRNSKKEKRQRGNM